LLHHATLLLGSPTEAESYLRALLKDLDFETKNNPDFVSFRLDTFGIDESRMLSTVAARKALVDRKVVLIIPKLITTEAQNALLKTFEDPFPDTHFFLVSKEEGLILPTLRSRMQIVRLSGERNTDEEAKDFLKLPIKDRLMFAKKFSDEEKSLPDFLDSLLVLLRKEKKEPALLKSIYDIRRFASDTSALPRLVIEHVALLL